MSRTTLFALAVLCPVTSAEAAAQGLVDSDPLCGAYCLYVGLGALDAAVPPFAEFKAELGEPEAGGFSLGELAENAEAYGLHTLGVQTNTGNLRRRPGRFACIAHLTRGHFVLLTDIAEGAVTVVDPPRTSTVSEDVLWSQWDGTALLISDQPLLAEEDLPGDRHWVWSVVGLVVITVAVGLWFVRRRTTEQAQ